MQNSLPIITNYCIFLSSKLLTDNYLSMTKVHFKPTKGSDGKDPFPKHVYMVKSGFVRDTTPTVPSTNKVL